MNFVLPGNTLLHDFQQVVICIPAVDHQRFLHGHGQTQLPLKHLHREAEKQNKDHDILIFNIQAYAAQEKLSLKLENPLQILLYLFLRWGVSRVFVGVVQAHLTKGHGFWMPHRRQYIALLNTRVVFGKMRVAPKCPPYHVFSQQTFPQRLFHHDIWVAEVCNTALKLSSEATLVQPSKAAERPAEAKFSIEHVQMAMRVYEASFTAWAGVAGP